MAGNYHEIPNRRELVPGGRWGLYWRKFKIGFTRNPKTAHPIAYINFDRRFITKRILASEKLWELIFDGRSKEGGGGGGEVWNLTESAKGNTLVKYLIAYKNHQGGPCKDVTAMEWNV